MINRRPVYIQQYFIQKATAVIGLNSIAPMQDNSTKKEIYLLRGNRDFTFCDHLLKRLKLILVVSFKDVMTFWLGLLEFHHEFPKDEEN